MPENPNTIYENAIQLSEEENAELELATLKTRDNFETYFTDDVTDIRAITYSDSPETLLNLLQEVGTDDVNLEVVVGDNTLDYRKKLRGKEQLAEQLERLQRENRLRIYLASLRGNEVHSKLYILQHQDGSRTNILGSPNLSEQGWGSTRQKNAIAVFRTWSGRVSTSLRIRITIATPERHIWHYLPFDWDSPSRVFYVTGDT